jgi:hypothetical protein
MEELRILNVFLIGFFFCRWEFLNSHADDQEELNNFNIAKERKNRRIFLGVYLQTSEC